MKGKPALAVLAPLVGVIATMSLGAAPALASASCGAPFAHDGITVQYCPVWVPQGGIPVFRSPADHTVVGRLYQGGMANWFGCEMNEPSLPTNMYGYSSTWYAYTQSDNGTWGYVSGIFYAGSANYFVGLNSCV